MTLFTSDYFEYYLTLVAWIINNGIWNVLAASGAIALPFIVIVIQEWLRARAEGADEGNKGVLSAVRIENRIWVAVIVVMFAGMPFIPIDLSTIQFDRTRSTQCQVLVPLPNDTRWEPAFTSLNNQTALVPVWWFFVHALSKAVTAAAVASIPCGTDLRQMRMEIDATRIDDPVISQELADFSRDCYGAARARLFMSRPEMTEQDVANVGWVGSQYFLSTAGYYDSLRSRVARSAWPYDQTRDAGLAAVTSGGGYPSCIEWWSDPGRGLRARILEQVDPTLVQRFQRWAGFLPPDEVDDAVIRAVASPRNQVMNQGQVYTDYGGQIGFSLTDLAIRVVSDVGVAVGALAFLPAMDAVRQAVPMVLSLTKMALVICIPLLLVIGTYELKLVMTASAVMFAVFFCDFWFQLARWLDNTILDALYGWTSPHSNLNALVGINNTFGDGILQVFVLATMFLILPTLWTIALGWAGIHVGGFLEGLSRGTRSVEAAGSKGPGTVAPIAFRK